MSEEIIIRSQKLTKTYGHINALKDANITIKRGSIYGLVGNNGAGKTTFLKILAGHIYQTSGTFEIMGADNEKGYKEVRKYTGAIIENPGFYPKLTAKANLEYYRIQRGIPGKDVVMKMLQEVGLEKAANRKFEALSLGMKQRLALALALMGNPELLILDEPINGLDPLGIIEVRNLLIKLNKERNVTILISSHILTELENIATDYGFLNKGELVEQISAEELKEKCRMYLEIQVTNASEYVALLETEMLVTNYKVLPGDVIHIFEDMDDVGKYSALAVNHGIGLLALNRKEINLENYYMNLIGAENQDENVQKEV